jgi:hypothetical protein
VHRGHNLAECSLCLPFGSVAAGPLLPPLISDRVAVKLDNNRVAVAAFDDTASHRTLGSTQSKILTSLFSSSHSITGNSPCVQTSDGTFSAGIASTGPLLSRSTS